MNTLSTNYSLTLYAESLYAKIYHEPSLGIVICELTADYIPIDEFKKTFMQMIDLVKGGGYTKFIFDKRALRAFHQPSMEWYFIIWKKQMMEHGVKTHRKILPDEPWFEKTVMIAKDQILKEFPDNIIGQLDIRYCNSIDEAIES
ncbi:hypothetical protein [Penaeicola halotolerans]|uniref:hypothetical protein n=1 Tax=Penaeicola halotolerans TaxID=2793196 RepID=UPI001CF80A72|nr:hypothetical protein [Penaeicola halotolerans]